MILMQTDWRPDDKDWLKQRKANWKYIKKSIKDHMRFTLSSEYSGLRDYYLTGEPNEAQKENDADLLFELWLHPDTSKARWQQIWQERLTKFAGTISWSSSFKKSREAFFRASSSPRCDPVFGVFGGMEERLLQFFLPIKQYTDEKIIIENREQRLCHWINPTEAYVILGSSFEIFLTREGENIYHYCQYLLDFWFTCFDHKLDYNYDADYMKLVYQVIYKSSQLSDVELHPVKLAFAKEVADALDTRPLPEPVQVLWTNAKS